MHFKRFTRLARRLAVWPLTISLLIGAAGPLSGLTAPARAASWAQPYLDKMVSWGVMRGDVNGNLDPARVITRAEFVTMVNRAFGYDRMGSAPFTDIKERDWYYDDIIIAYSMGYFKGASATTALPEGHLTREQAVVLICRNLMAQPRSGEALGFSDTRDFANYSRGYVEEAAERGIVSGFVDGSFGPKKEITCGEAAAMLVRAIGTPINSPGEQSLGNIYGNVLISTSGVKLRNTTIAGDLYLTGGIDLGDVLLENVKVLGRIIVSGAGEGNKGENSVIFRNVTAESMVVDSLKDQFVSIRAEGDTDIGTTSVRTSAYLEDVVGAGLGLRYIELNGEEGTELQVAGNVKEVVNKTPNSKLTVARGAAQKVTVDETAAGSALSVERGGVIQELNLDTGTPVTGQGDLDKLNINATGSTITMPPDNVIVRPGLSAGVAGEALDSSTAQEYSEEPRLLAGYPAMRNVAPTSAEAVFSANKKGTVYWAVSSIADGSVGAEDLIAPPAYTTKILKSGSTNATASKTEANTKLSGLTTGGSYYLSAVLVDSRGHQSPVKVSAFTTPDDSVPQFASGYPYMSKVTKDSAQVTVMPTKSCQLYYAVLPKGSTAPAVSDFKTGAISGSLGYGSRDVTKNVVDVFQVNGRLLQELVDYDLYLLLIDADGGQNSGVKKVSFKTVDGTPPVFLTAPTPNKVQATSVGLVAALNENGTIFWAVVKEGEEYPKPMAGTTGKPALNSDQAKLQVSNGMNALKSGKVSATGSRDVTVNVSGLTGESAYDLYYLAQDTAGNFSDEVKKITIHTLDTNGPKISQRFLKTADEAGKEPLPDTDIEIIFSEGVQDNGGDVFLNLYNASLTGDKREESLDKLVSLLRKDIQLYDVSKYPTAQVEEKKDNETPAGAWIDFRKVKISMREGQTVFTFANNEAIHLNSGATYYFQIKDIADTSNGKNLISPNPTKLEQFTLTFAELQLTNQGVTNGPLKRDASGKEETDDDKKGTVTVDMSFQIHPMSTSTVDDTICYDVFLWSGMSVQLDLYARVRNDKGSVQDANKEYYIKKDDLLGDLVTENNKPDTNGWVYVGNLVFTTEDDQNVGRSIRQAVTGGSASHKSPQLNSLQEDMTYEYAISLTQIGTESNREGWSDRVTVGVTVPAGTENSVSNLSRLITENKWNDAVKNGLNKDGIRPIGSPRENGDVFAFSVYKQFTDTAQPKFEPGSPKLTPGDGYVNMNFMTDRQGTLYYVLAPMGTVKGDNKNILNPSLTTRDGKGVIYPDSAWHVSGASDTSTNYPLKSGAPWPDPAGSNAWTITAPTSQAIFQGRFSSADIKKGSTPVSSADTPVTVKGLKANTVYYAYFVLKGASQDLSHVYLYQFTTGDVTKPAITLYNRSPEVQFITSASAELNYAVVPYQDIPSFFNDPFSQYCTETSCTHTKTVDKKSVSITVLEAMKETASGTGYSVFDQFAKEDIKTQVADYIRGRGATSGSGNRPTATGSFELTENTPRNENFEDKLKTSTLYYCLAVAHNPQGVEDAFRAVDNLQIPDRVPPEFKSVTTTFTSITGTDENKTYSGSVTVSFDKSVYFMKETGADRTARPVYVAAGPKDEKAPEDPADAVYLHNHAMGTFPAYGVFALASPASSFTIQFDNIRDGATITLFTDGFIANASSATTTRKLTLRFSASGKVPSGFLGDVETGKPQFIAIWG